MLTDDNAYYLRLLRLLLLPSGIVVQPEYKKYRIPYVVFILCFTCSCTSGIFAALFIPNASRMQITETIYALNAGLNTIEIFIVQQLVRKKVLDLYDDIRRYYFMDDLFAEISDRQVIKMMDKKWLIICSYTCFSLPPLILMSTTNVSMDDMRALNFPLLCPWKVNTIWKYLITMGIEVLATTMTSVLLFTGFCIIYCYTVAIRSHGEIFTRDLDECFQLSTDSRIVKEKFIIIVKKHQELMKFTKKVVDISSYVVEIFTMIFVVSCIILISIFLQAPDEYLYNLKLICGTLNMTLIFYWSCRIGDELSNLTDQIKQKVYETEWYNQDVEIQKMVLLFMIQNQQEFRLKIFNLYWITLHFFKAAVKNCYNTIQLLSASI